MQEPRSSLYSSQYRVTLAVKRFVQQFTGFHPVTVFDISRCEKSGTDLTSENRGRFVVQLELLMGGLIHVAHALTCQASSPLLQEGVVGRDEAHRRSPKPRKDVSHELELD